MDHSRSVLPHSSTPHLESRRILPHKMRSLMFGLAIFAILAQVTLCQDDVPCPVLPSMEEVLINPPEDLNDNCITKELMTEFFESRDRVEALVECMEDINLCQSHGYKRISDRLFERLGTDAECIKCSKRIKDLMTFTDRRIRVLYPDLHKRIIYVLG